MPENATGKHKYWEPLIVAIAAAIGMLAGYNMNFNNNDYSLLSLDKNESSVNRTDGRIEEILRFIETNYVDSLDQDVIAVDAIKHVLRQLDPHSSYISQDELAEHNEKMEGEYNGIGIETIEINDTFFITRVLDGSPALRGGVKLGDAVISVNSDLVAGNKTPFDNIRDYFKTGKFASLDLELLSIGESENHIVKVQPEVIAMASANSSYLIDDKTAYLQMTRFSSNTYEQFMQSVERLIGDKTSLNLIIDLRDNPGGFLPEAISILSQLFEDKDKLLCFTEGLNRKKSEYYSTGKPFYKIDKIAVLINEYAASGSEILAGAIQDWDRGIVIGHQSYGKGLVQEIFPLKNGGALRLTVAKYYTPSGRLIQKSYKNINNRFEIDSNHYKTLLLERNVEGGGGIIPDIEVDDNFGDYCYSLMGFADYFLLERMRLKKSSHLTREDFNSELFIDYIVMEYLDKDSETIVNCDDDFTDYLESRYIRMIKGEVEYLKDLNASDNYVLKALDFIGDGQSTMTLLAQNIN